MSRLVTPFGFYSTAAEVIAAVDLTSKRAIVNRRSLGHRNRNGTRAVCSGRRGHACGQTPGGAEPVADALRQSTGNRAIDVREFDLSDLRSVRGFFECSSGYCFRSD